MVKAGGVFKRVLLCVQGGPKWAACQQGLKLGGKAGCRVGRNKGKLESMRTNSNLPVYPLLHPQPCGWLAGRSWQPSPPSHTGSWPRPHEVEGDQQEVRPRRPSYCPPATEGAGRSAATWGAALGALHWPCGNNGYCFPAIFKITHKFFLWPTLTQTHMVKGILGSQLQLWSIKSHHTTLHAASVFTDAFHFFLWYQYRIIYM